MSIKYTKQKTQRLEKNTFLDSSMALGIMLTQAEAKPKPSLVAFQNDGNDQVHHLRGKLLNKRYQVVQVPSGNLT